MEQRKADFEARSKSEAEDLKKKLEETTVVVEKKSGEDGKLLDQVTASRGSDALNEKGFEIDKKK